MRTTARQPANQADSLLDENSPNSLPHKPANHPAPNNDPSPRINHLRQTRPEAILLTPPHPQLLVLILITLLIPLLLARLVLLIPTNTAKIDVIRNGAEQNHRIELISRIQEPERAMHQRIPEVTIAVSPEPFTDQQ